MRPMKHDFLGFKLVNMQSINARPFQQIIEFSRNVDISELGRNERCIIGTVIVLALLLLIRHTK